MFIILCIRIAQDIKQVKSRDISLFMHAVKYQILISFRYL